MKITRSFSKKIKIGDYLTADFFASCESEIVNGKKAIDTSECLDIFCQDEVEKSIKNYKQENNLDDRTMKQKWLEWMKDYEAGKIKSDYGKPTPQENYETESKLDDIKRELEEK